MAARKSTRGRDTKYKKEYAEQAFKLCLLGADDNRIADFFEVTARTINTWKKQYPEFFQSLKEGKDQADAAIADSLYHRAKGYSHKEDKIFNDGGKPLIVPTIKHYPPDTTAAIFWLKNRQKDKWRDKTDHDHTSSDGSMSPDGMTPEQRQARIKALMSKGDVNGD